jgi:hypothetical protein
MSSCCMNQFNELTRNLYEPSIKLSDRLKALAPSRTSVKSFLELLLIATAIVTMALI